MSEWKECKLGDVVVLNYGKGLKEDIRVNGDVPVYSSSGLSGWHNEHLVNSKGIIVGRKGTIGKIYKSEKPFFCIDTAYYILPNDKEYDFNYLYYCLQTLGLEELNSDSAVPGLNRNAAYNQTILLPPLPEQKAIAAVLSSLDDKIDLLHRQNKTLEAMAETLFRQWFVEPCKNGLPEGWEEKPIGDLFDISSGKGLKKEEFNDKGTYPVLGANGEIGRTEKYLFDEKLIFTGRVGTLGNVFIVNNEKVWLSDNTLVIKPYNFFYLIYYILKTIKLEEYNVGSTQPLIRQSDIKAIEFALPSNATLKKFENETELLFSKINLNNKQIRTLEKLRDTLLPKLMSGEVRVEV